MGHYLFHSPSRTNPMLFVRYLNNGPSASAPSPAVRFVPDMKIYKCRATARNGRQNRRVGGRDAIYPKHVPARLRRLMASSIRLTAAPARQRERERERESGRKNTQIRLLMANMISARGSKAAGGGCSGGNTRCFARTA